LLGSAEGSRASADNRSIWLGLLGPNALLKTDTLRFVGWFLLVRAFTPLGAGLAMLGLGQTAWIAWRGRNAIDRSENPGNGDALWLVWGTSALGAMACLAEKLHHEYYWLVLAPVAAVGIGRSLAFLAHRRLGLAVAVGAALCVLSCIQVRSTWQAPAEWHGLDEAARAVAATAPADAWVIAPEALLFQADRRGCRMEWSDAAAARAAGEWGAGKKAGSPLELVEYYRGQGARYFADIVSPAQGQGRKGLHDAVRRRYKVIVDRSDCLIADLADSEAHSNAN
jgi:hypothetical protein